MTRTHHKARKSTARSRNAARPSSAFKPSGDGGAPGSDDDATRPTVPVRRASGPPMSDALALCGLLLSTLGPHAAFELLKRILFHAGEIAVSIGVRAQRGAELAREEARTRSVPGARSSRHRRGRVSRTTSSP